MPDRAGAVPTVSVGLPVYNGAAYLRQALDSLLGQTFGDLELIVSDNASTDATAEIGAEYAARDRRVRYSRNASNLGPDANFARVFALSRGRYFKWAAHDDLYAPTYLARCVGALEADPSAVVCHSRSVLVDAAGDRIGEAAMRQGRHVDRHGQVTPLRPALDPPRRLDAAEPHVRFGEVLLRTGYCFEIFGLARAEAIRRGPLPSGFLGSDKVLLADLALRGRFLELPEELFFRRCHPRQGSSLPPEGRAAFVHPTRTLRSRLPQQLFCLHGYARALRRAELSRSERLRCVASLARWLAQTPKWRLALGAALRRAG